MSLHAAIASHLLNDSDVALLVGDRVYRTIAPQDTAYPYITYQRITERRGRHFTAPAGLLATGMQIDCWSQDSNEVLDLADAVRRSLDHKNHAGMGLAPHKITINAAFLESSLDAFEEPSDKSDRGVFRVIQFWEIWHTETLPELAV